MAVFEVVTWEVKPGRMDEALAAVKDVISVCRRIDTGLTSIRVASTVIGGESSGRLVAIFEHTDLASWGTSIETEENDSEFQAIAKRFGTDSPTTGTSRYVLKEIEL